MDIKYFINSYSSLYPILKKNFSIYSLFSIKELRKITKIFEDPINIIENIFIGNLFNSSNYCILRDYNFKLVINISEDIDNFFENSDIKCKYIKFNIEINTTNKQYDEENILKTIDTIINFQSKINSKTLINNNILIYSDNNEKICIFLYYFLNNKYNLSKNKTKNLLNNFNLIENTNILDIIL